MDGLEGSVDDEMSALRHGIPGVDCEVHRDLLHHTAVGENSGQRFFGVVFNFHLLPD
jgi:hypothetical protein